MKEIENKSIQKESKVINDYAFLFLFFHESLLHHCYLIPSDAFNKI
jgi:hypothetical protein